MQANRFLVFLALFCCAIGFAQNDTVVLEKSKFEPIIVNTKFLPSPKTDRHFEANSKEKYSGQDFVYEHKAHEKTLWERFKAWLAYLLSRIFRMSNQEASMKVLDIILKVIAVIIIAIVIYVIFKIYRNKEAKWIFGKKNSTIGFDGEEIVDIKSANFETLIANAVEKGDRRLAIRYYYLFLLQKLSDRNLIDWDPEKTNLDYANELKDSNLKEEFSYLSYLYDHAWYGDIVFDQSAFETTTKSFNNAIKKIR